MFSEIDSRIEGQSDKECGTHISLTVNNDFQFSVKQVCCCVSDITECF